jgi:hypothetical protein
MNFDYPDGATPLDTDEAEAWAFRRKPRDILTVDFIKRMHKRMFGNVWRWGIVNMGAAFITTC